MYDAVEGKRRLVLLKSILLLTAVFALVYYVVIVSILGFRKDFSLIWPVCSLICIAVYRILVRMQKNEFGGIVKFADFLLAVLAVFLILFCMMEGIIIRTGFQKPNADADYLVVLGAQVNGTKVSRALRYRLDAAYKYAAENESTRLIVSGGQGVGEDISEAQAMQEYLLLKGLDAERIVLEDKSTNTNENIMFSKTYLKDADSVIIVTNRFHLYRGIQIARKQLDMQVEGLGADTGTVLFINYYVREAFAIVKDKLVHNI